MDLAKALVESLTEKVNLSDFRDTYTDELLEIIKQKANGKKIRKPQHIRTKEIPDLVRALEESLKNMPYVTKEIPKEAKSRSVGRT